MYTCRAVLVQRNVLFSFVHRLSARYDLKCNVIFLHSGYIMANFALLDDWVFI